MTNRKIWTDKQDQVLKYLIEQLKLTKWAQISHKMNSQYQFSCNERQCRSRYVYKLAKNVNASPLTPQEQIILFDMQSQFGNRWALIASKLGRIDSYVKNYFYAKLRRCLRKVNKFIGKNMAKEFHKIQTASLYKLIESLQTHDDSRKIKEKLIRMQDSFFESKNMEEKMQFVKDIMLNWSLLQPQLVKGHQNNQQGPSLMQIQSESYHSSNASSHHHTINSYNSSSHSNSHSNSNNSDLPLHNVPRFLSTNQNFLSKPLQMKRSHSIQSDEQGLVEQENPSFLYKSSNLDNRSKKAQQKPNEKISQDYLASSVNMLQQIQQIQIIKINFISPRVSSQSSSKRSDRIAIQIDQHQAEISQTKQSPSKLQQNLWEALLSPGLNREKNPFDC